jgi:hypothetical protein
LSQAVEPPGLALRFVLAHCPRCGAELPVDTIECPTCAYGDVEDIVLLEAQSPRPVRPEPPATPSSLPRVLAALAILIVVIVAIFAALR